MPESVRFTGFSGLAVLYAQNALLVHRFTSAFDGDVTMFIGALRRELEHILHTNVCEDLTEDGHCEWWRIFPQREHTGAYVRLRLNRCRPESVWPGELHVQFFCETCAATYGELQNCCCPGAPHRVARDE